MYDWGATFIQGMRALLASILGERINQNTENMALIGQNSLVYGIDGR